MISANLWYNLMWPMMLDIIMYITFLPSRNKYPATRFIYVKKYIVDNQKVQVADEIGQNLQPYTGNGDVSV